MRIDILTIPFFANLNIEADRGIQNSGGGMACLMNSTLATLKNNWQTVLCHDFSEISADFVIFDILYFSHYGGSDHKENAKVNINAFESLKNENPNRKYLLWCAEKTLLRLEPECRKRLIKLVDGIAVTCKYLWDLFKSIGVTPMGYLCDGVDSNLFRPREKQMSVTAVGGLKHIKNVDWIIEVYRLLEGKLPRYYFGSSALWSNENRPEDASLVTAIKEVTEHHIPNASPVQVAYRNGDVLFAVNDTWHDCSSRANEELLMAGAISIHGGHPLFDDRPGFRVKTPEEAVDVMAELTDDFKKMPDPKYAKESRKWALENCSDILFMRQFEMLMRCFI